MVRLPSLAALSALLSLAEFVSAGVAPRHPHAAMITPAPISPFDPRSPLYAMLGGRDNKNSQQVITADMGKSTCGFQDGDAKKPQTCGQGNCYTSGGYFGCADGDSSSSFASCINSADANNNNNNDGEDSDDEGGNNDNGNNDNDDNSNNDDNSKRALRRLLRLAEPRDDNDDTLSCTDAKNNACVTFFLGTGNDQLSSFSCGTKSSTVQLQSVVTVSTTSSSSSSSSSSSTTTSSATTTSATASATATAAPEKKKLNSYAIAGIVIGIVLGLLALAALAYHFISSRMSPEDDDGHDMPLMENKSMAWKGPWQGRGAE